MPDTDIELSVGLNVVDAEKSAKELQKEIKNALESNKGQKSAALTNFEIQMKKTRQQSVELQKSISGIHDELDKLSDKKNTIFQLEDSEKSIRNYKEALTEYERELNKARDAARTAFEFDVDGVRMQLADVKTALDDAIRTGNEDAIKYYQEAYDTAIKLADNEKIFWQGNTAFGGRSASIRELEELYDEMSNKYINMQKEQNALIGHARQIGVDIVDGKASHAYDQIESIEFAEQQLNDTLDQQLIKHDQINDKMKQELIKAQELEVTQPFKDGQSEVTSMTKSMRSLSMTTRGLSRLIPGLNASAIYGVTALSNGLTRLTHLTKKDLVAAIVNVKNAVLKLFSVIMAHPVIAIITAIIAGLLLLIRTMKNAKNELEKNLEELSEKFIELSKNIGATAGKIIRGVVEGLTKINLLITKTLLKGFKKLFNLVYVKGVIGGLTAIISKLSSMKSVITENLKLMAQWNNGNNKVNKSLSNITSSLTYLKASITTVFAPILTTIEPILVRIIDRLAEAATAVGMFIAKLTGQSTFQKAIRKQKDYAESLKDTNKQLASFDKLNVLSQKANDSSVGFEMVDIEEIELQKQSIQDWFDTLEQKGKEVGENITNFLTSIPWESVEEGATNAGKAVAGFINGLSSTDGLGSSIGTSLGGLINTVNGAIDGFLKDLKAKDLGGQISDILTGMVTTVKWGDFGDTFSTLLDDIIDIVVKVFETDANGENLGSRVGDALNEFLAHALTFNWDKASEGLASIVNNLQSFFDKLFNKNNPNAIKWDKLGTKMGRFVKRAVELINWEKIGKTLFSGFKSALAFLRGFITGLSGTKTAKAVSDFLAGALKHDKLTWDEIEQDCNDIAVELANFLNGVITPENFQLVSNTLTNVLTTLFTSIKLFGDTAKWKTWGDSIATACNEFFADDDMWNNMTDAVNSFTSGIFDMIVQAIDKINWYGEGEGGWDNSVAGRIIKFLTDIKWDEIGNKIYHVSTELRKGFEKLWDQLKENGTFDEIIELIVMVMSEIDKWKAAFKRVKKETVKAAFRAEWTGTFEAVGKYLLDCIFHPFTKHNITEYLDASLKNSGVKTVVTDSGDVVHVIHDKFPNLSDINPIDGSSNTERFFSKVESTYDKNEYVFSNLGGSIEGLTDSVDKLDKTMTQQELEAARRSGAYIGPRASGAVIPPSHSKYLATVGDNNHETEVISPLSTIKQALIEAMGNQAVNVTFQVEGDPNGIFKVVQKESVRYNQRTGNSAFA